MSAVYNDGDDQQRSPMRITLTGASGFIGSRLVARLHERGHELHLLGRAPRKGMLATARFSIWDAATSEPPLDALEGARTSLEASLRKETQPSRAAIAGGPGGSWRGIPPQ